MSDRREAHFETRAAEEINSSAMAIAASRAGVDITRFPIREVQDLPKDVIDFVDGRGGRVRFNARNCTTQDVVACLAEHLKREAEVNEEQERLYLDGQKRAWLTVLQLALSNLGDDATVVFADVVRERTEAVLKLREICERWGDNDWEDDLYLADILDKHLAVHLTEELG